MRHVNTTANFGAVKIDSILLDGQPLNLRYATSEPSGADLTPYAPWLLIPGQSWLKLVFSSTAPLSAGQLVINYHWGTTYPDVPFAASSPGPAAFTLDTCPPPYPAA